MYEICRAKFSQNPNLAKKLLATGDEELAEKQMERHLLGRLQWPGKKQIRQNIDESEKGIEC